MTPIISIVGKSNSGKTTLIEKLLHVFVARGLKVATVKHDSHGFDVDHEGKDTWRHREAGAAAVAIISPKVLFLTRNVDEALELETVRQKYLNEDYDFILTEGFKRSRWPKIEVHRRARSDELICTPEQDNLIAVASDHPWDLSVPTFDLNDGNAIADFIIQFVQAP